MVLNAAAWTHYSYALLDACAQLTAPLVEVHISDPQQRPEQFRHHSVVSAYAVEVIAGQGIDGYRQALQRIAASRWLRSEEHLATSLDPRACQNWSSRGFACDRGSFVAR